MKNKMFSQSVADSILSMITIEKRFSVGDKVPNEIELSEELNVSRTTLREAIRTNETLALAISRCFSFTFSFVYAVTKCANEIEEFRCRFVEGKPAIFETINISFTYLDETTELFKVVNVPMKETIEEYVALAKKTEEKSICLFQCKCIIHLLMVYILEKLQCYLDCFE